MKSRDQNYFTKQQTDTKRTDGSELSLLDVRFVTPSGRLIYFTKSVTGKWYNHEKPLGSHHEQHKQRGPAR